jgi:hypothetical protein
VVLRRTTAIRLFVHSGQSQLREVLVVGVEKTEKVGAAVPAGGWREG